jgi:hypothetical protein
MYAYVPGAPPPPPLRKDLAVFRRPRRRADVLPARLLEHLSLIARLREVQSDDAEPAAGFEASPAPSRLFRRKRPVQRSEELLAELRRRRQREIGMPIADDSRLLVTQERPTAAQLFAIPTTTGAVTYLCSGGGDLGGGSTADSLDNGFTWYLNWSRKDNVVRTVVFGLVADDVVVAEVDLAGVRHRAEIGENGFLVQLVSERHFDAVSFHLVFRDGSEHSERTDG